LSRSTESSKLGHVGQSCLLSKSFSISLIDFRVTWLRTSPAPGSRAIADRERQRQVICSMTDSRAAVFSEGAPDQLIIRFVKGEELHSSPMVSYRAKAINKFTPVNLRLPDSNRREGIFLLAALVSTGSPPATARLLCSTRSGVTCHPSSRRRRRRAFHFHGYRTVTPAPKARTSLLTVPKSSHCRVGIGAASGS